MKEQRIITSEFKTSKDYSKLTLHELFEELFAAAGDLVEYKRRMEAEYKALKEEVKNGHS